MKVMMSQQQLQLNSPITYLYMDNGWKVQQHKQVDYKPRMPERNPLIFQLDKDKRMTTMRMMMMLLSLFEAIKLIDIFRD